jgi:hypothetical protein
LFGRFFQWLAFGAAHPAYDPIRDLVFGEQVRTRTLHSIRTLSLVTGLHPKRLRKLVQAAGMMGDDQTTRKDALVVLDASAALRLAAKAKNFHDCGPFIEFY